MKSDLSAGCGRPARLRFLHDGTAAAAANGEETVSAVITVGSWLGIGFTPAPSRLAKVSPYFPGVFDEVL